MGRHLQSDITGSLAYHYLGKVFQRGVGRKLAGCEVRVVDDKSVFLSNHSRE